ncbi:MAG: hypothetical protein AB1488_01015 [Nitrospirota bacterium]
MMAEGHGNPRKKPYFKAIFWGIFSIGLYIAVFINQNTVTDYFTRGGWYAALPIITVFIFSFVHGAFASYLLSCLGIEAVKKKK